MQYIVVGLGNPGEEYARTRHNAGRMAVDYFARKEGAVFKADGILKAQKAKIKNDIDALLLLPDTFMNKSGMALKPLVTSEKKAKALVVVYDDMDLPLGTIRIAFGRSAGGHHGLESVIKTVKTKDFTRIRIGVAPTTPSGKLKKPTGADAVITFLMDEFSKKEQPVFTEVTERVSEALRVILGGDLAKAMNRYNS